MGKGNSPNLLGNIKSVGDTRPSLDVSSPKIKSPHCSHCGHPGSKRAHLKFACEYCFSSASEGCVTKPVGFKCDCSSCDMVCLKSIAILVFTSHHSIHFTILL